MPSRYSAYPPAVPDTTHVIVAEHPTREGSYVALTRARDQTRLTLVHPPSAGPKTVEVRKTEEKGSDVNLASYLLLDAFRKDCDVAIVISNDADLKEPIAIAKDALGIKVGVVNPHPPARRSRDLRPTFFRQLRRGPVAASQFRAVMTDTRGQFHKPAAW